MREIKFRGKRKDNGEWVVGYYGYKDLSDEHFIIAPTFDAHSEKRPQYFTDNLVEPETIGQFAGIKDKNGKEIYEGDVIQTFKWDVHQRFNEGTENEYVTQKKVEHNIVVKWDDYNARFIVSDTVVTPLAVFMEVIGNIYENPDLLK